MNMRDDVMHHHAWTPSISIQTSDVSTPHTNQNADRLEFRATAYGSPPGSAASALALIALIKSKFHPIHSTHTRIQAGRPMPMTADPVGVLQWVGLGCSAYIASIGGWRWLTYEARCVLLYIDTCNDRRAVIDIRTHIFLHTTHTQDPGDLCTAGRPGRHPAHPACAPRAVVRSTPIHRTVSTSTSFAQRQYSHHHPHNNATITQPRRRRCEGTALPPPGPVRPFVGCSGRLLRLAALCGGPAV